MKIGVRSFVKAKVAELENITRWVRSKGISKEMVRCVQPLEGNNKFPFQFKDRKKKQISYTLLVFLNSKEEVEVDEEISYSPKK